MVGIAMYTLLVVTSSTTTEAILNLQLKLDFFLKTDICMGMFKEFSKITTNEYLAMRFRIRLVMEIGLLIILCAL